MEPAIAPELAEGRRQIPVLAHSTPLALADSTYNASDLLRAGYPNVEVVPILLDVEMLSTAADPAARDRLMRAKDNGGADWLFVGRICPNKAQHDIVKAFSVHRRLHDPQARLHFIGTSSSHAYSTAVEDFAAALGLGDAVNFAGSVSDGEKAAYFGAADVYVCLSDHEGFNVPLIEAFAHDLPVVAFNAAATPETLGDGGLVLDDKDPAIVAGAVQRVLTDEALRTQLVTAGRRRLDDFSLQRSEAKLRQLIEKLVAGN